MTRLHRAALGGLSFVALGLASCSTQGPAPRPRPAPGPVIAPLARGLDAASYIATAASIDLFVVRASDLALKRSSNARIRALATRLGAEHRGLAGQLSFAGRRINRLPAARMLPREEQRLSALNTRRSTALMSARWCSPTNNRLRFTRPSPSADRALRCARSRPMASASSAVTSPSLVRVSRHRRCPARRSIFKA